jgi:uncharacterized membrane protein YdbT with pleckstrin-like domain
VTYPRRLLGDHEAVTVDLHPHSSYLAVPVLAVIASIGGALVVLLRTDADTTARTAGSWGVLAALVASSLWLVVRYARWITTHFVVTDRRVIFRSGLLTKRGVEIPLDRVNTVHFTQGVFERLVGAGDLMIESGGESGQQRFTDIRQPDRVQKVIHAEMDARRRGGERTLDLAERLEKLEAMMLRGTLTPEEFDLQKQRLLGR